MHYLSRLTPADAEITLEKLDKVAKSLNEKVKFFVKLFGIFIGWCIFNVIIALFYSRTHGLSLDAYRTFIDELRIILTEDIFYVLTLIFDNKIGYGITLAMIIAFGLSFFVLFLNLNNDGFAKINSNQHSKDYQSELQSKVYVVSYKQRVAVLS